MTQNYSLYHLPPLQSFSSKMFLKMVFFCFIAYIALITSFVKSAIFYEPNWEVPYPGTLDSRAIYFVGEPNEYEIFPTNYGGSQQSDAQCQRLLNDQQGHFTGPCETSIAKHDQSFNVQCTANRKNAASIVFFKDGGNTDHQASIVTAGSIYGGFTYENDDQPLRQSTTKAIIGKGDRISVILNCGSSKRAY